MRATVLASLVVVTLSAGAHAQDTRTPTTTRTSSVLMVRSSGEPAGIRQTSPTRPVPSLTNDQIKILLQPLGYSLGIGTEPVKLTTMLS